MPGFELSVAASADRALARLPESAATAMVEFMTGPLLDEPARVGKPPMFELEGYLVARRGAYRIVYRIEGATVLVVRIAHRADVYRTR